MFAEVIWGLFFLGAIVFYVRRTGRRSEIAGTVAGVLAMGIGWAVDDRLGFSRWAGELAVLTMVLGGLGMALAVYASRRSALHPVLIAGLILVSVTVLMDGWITYLAVADQTYDEELTDTSLFVLSIGLLAILAGNWLHRRRAALTES